MESLTNFLKDLGLLSLLNILVTVILILAGFVTLIVARTRRAIYRLLAIASLPLLLGALSMYVKNRALDEGYGMFGRLNAQEIVAGRREALIIACIGAAGTIVLVLIGLFGLKRNRNA
jgi:asparagine N-glycosylation enzyme membrane subunit Stt3